MALKVFTAQYRYSGPDRFDITVKGGVAKAFAPTWDMVMSHKNGTLTNEDYTAKYIVMMKTSQVKYRAAWEDLFNKDEVTLVCFCNQTSFCHRNILANILRELGAYVMGPR